MLDHRRHPGVTALLDLAHADDVLAWANLLARAVEPLGDPDHPTVSWILKRLGEAREADTTHALDEPLSVAKFWFATLVLHKGNTELANDLYTEVVYASDPSWSVHADARNNRGNTWWHLGRRDLAREDFTAVIDSPVASNEVRAMSYNNRADTYDNERDTSSAIADRTAVLELADTSFNRRYIALSRRARALRTAGDYLAAAADIDTILNVSDIVIEQKMAARLQRAKWWIDEGRFAEANLDLEAILASEREIAFRRPPALLPLLLLVRV
jgi:tetratricopeptide (TPR) repeat protein